MNAAKFKIGESVGRAETRHAQALASNLPKDGKSLSLVAFELGASMTAEIQRWLVLLGVSFATFLASVVWYGL